MRRSTGILAAFSVFVFLLSLGACSGSGPGGSGNVPGEASGGTAASAGTGGSSLGTGATSSTGGSSAGGSSGVGASSAGGMGAADPAGGGGFVATGATTGAGGGGDGASGGAAAGVGGSAGEQFKKTSAELLDEMNLGWNLGNSLDAPEGETAWGNPLVKKELLDAVAARGFRLVRIPVTWSLHMSDDAESLIEASFFDRVEEVVGYAHAAGLTAIINIHHDGADGYDGVEWLTLNDASGAVTDANNAAVEARFVAVWSQIAERFAHYGENLLFESMNEIHDGYDQPDPRYYEIINHLNQRFVDLVRASGGNNAQRHLVVPGYNTNIDYTLEGFTPPTDSTPNRLILSVHYYDPYTFALTAETNTWGASAPGNDGWGQEDFVVSQFDKLKARYIDQGLPMIIGEYGAVHQEGFEDFRRYYVEYVTKAAVERGIVPVYWDNGAEGSGAENLGLFSRSTYQELHPAILDAMFRAARDDTTLDQVAPAAP